MADKRKRVASENLRMQRESTQWTRIDDGLIWVDKCRQCHNCLCCERHEKYCTETEVIFLTHRLQCMYQGSFRNPEGCECKHWAPLSCAAAKKSKQ